MTPTLVRLDRRPPEPAEQPELDDAQRQVIAHRSGPLLVLAGPGTGKTTTLVETMAARLADGEARLPAETVLGLTFGRRAAGEMRDRVAARVGGGAVPLVSTFHSFAYALLHRFADPDLLLAPPRLLSGPEQELRLRELLRGSLAEGSVPWPDWLRPAIGTHGFGRELRALLARMRSLGLDPEDLADAAALAEAGDGERRISGASGVSAWPVVARFAEDYLDVLDAEGVLDYAELVHRAAILAERPDVQAELHARLRLIVVDEYQDTDPAQVRLLRALAGPATTLIAVGDPDQAIYAFRGADLGGLLRFREDFRTPAGDPAPVVVLDRARRFGPVLGRVARGILGDRGFPGMPATAIRRHRAPRLDPALPGSVEVLTFDDDAARAEHVAHLLRGAHLDGLAWSRMAVLVRAGGQFPSLQRALLAAGVPVAVAGDELPLHREQAVAPLLLALRVAADPAALTPAAAEELLASPLGGLDPHDRRRLAQALRRVEREAAESSGRPVRTSGQLVRDLLAEGIAPTAPPPMPALPPIPAPVRALRQALASARSMVQAGAEPQEVLWRLWAGRDDAALRAGWPARLERTALAGGAAGRRADRDLDAVCALMAAAHRASDRFRGAKGVAAFLADLAGEEVAGVDPGQEASVRGDAVRLLTAHRAKGLEWDLVVVAGLEEGRWPDLRLRGSLLAAERLARGGFVPAPTSGDLLAEERRLFYVACTRARRRLVITALAGAGDDAEQPSRFLADLDGPVRHVRGRPGRAVSLEALVADLRAAAVDPAVDSGLRAAAVRRLGWLAAQCSASGAPLVPAADPRTWWGVRPITPGAAPVRPADEPVAMSGSALSGIRTCPLQWFLAREAGGDVARTSAVGLGSLVHVLADRVAAGELEPQPEELDAALDTVWSRLDFEAGWRSEQEREEARAVVRRFLAYHAGAADEGRRLVASEHPFDVTRTVPGPDGTEQEVRLRGVMDRVEVDDAGLVRVADLKTGRRSPSAAEVREHPQLGVYQAAIRQAACPEAGREPGGASLVQMRTDASGRPGHPVVLVQNPPERGPGVDWIDQALGAAAALVRSERFPAQRGQACQHCSFRPLCPAWPEGEVVVP